MTKKDTEYLSNTTNNSELADILKKFNGRISALEMYVKMLDSSLMKFISSVEILQDKEIITKKEIDEKIDEIIKKGNEIQDKMREGFLDILTDEDIGHA